MSPDLDGRAAPDTPSPTTGAADPIALRNSIRDLCTLTLGSATDTVQDQKDGLARVILNTIGRDLDTPTTGAAPGRVELPGGDPLADLVSRFSVALLDKLRAAEAKYGHGDAWMRDDWRESLCEQIAEHVGKGDPRDVAAYAAFAWHHGWSTAGTPRLTLNEWAAKSHRDQATWWMDPATGLPVNRNDGELLMLMVSEISEGMEGIRKGLMDDKLPHRRMIEVEMADLFIRMMDFAGARGLDLDGAVAEKTAFNATRKDHTPEARLAAGGKRF